MDRTLAVVIARAGSKGLPNKCVAWLNGRAVIEYTLDTALAAQSIDAVCLTTDSDEAKHLARRREIFVVDRPAELASDTATVDSAVRHAVEVFEAAHTGFHAASIVLLYGNVPIRPAGAIDRAIKLLREQGCDSVRTVAPVTKQHPDWIHRMNGDQLVKFRENSIYRRQDLDPLFYHDGAVVAVTRESLFSKPKDAGDFHAFFGHDRRAVVVDGSETVDIDDRADLRLAQALLGARSMEPLIVGAARIGEGHATYIIAEAGVNHDGRLADALKLIDAAKAAGANAVKFQAFAADRLVTRGAAACDYQREHDAHSHSQHAMLKRLELSSAQFSALHRHAREVGIDFWATPFGLDDLHMLVDLGVPAIKLASPDLVNVPLVEAAAATGLPLIVSTGAALDDEIDGAVWRLRRSGAGDRLALLHCVSSYPTPLEEANLSRIRTLCERHRVPVGFSDHTRETSTAALAVAAGAALLEKHLTLDRNAGGPDHFFSLDPSGMRAYVAAARSAEAILGDGTARLSAGQLETRGRARGHVVAGERIAPGQTLTPENLTIKRTGESVGLIDGRGLSRLFGRRAAAEISADTPIVEALLRPETTEVGRPHKSPILSETGTPPRR